MRVTTLLLVAGALLAFGASSATQDAIKGDEATLQGAWSIVSVEIDGKPLAMDKLKDSLLTVRGTQYSFQLDETRLEFAFKVNATKTPKVIDLRVLEGTEKGKVYQGIYKFEKDRYIICRPTMPDKDRPAEFSTRADSGLMMVVWKKKK